MSSSQRSHDTPTQDPVLPSDGEEERHRGHGKLLLFGEHAVVHGRPALAAGIPRGVTARVVPGHGRLRVPAWNLDVSPGEGSRIERAWSVLGEGIDTSAIDVVARPAIPPGVGLGSSAALSVAVTRALLAHRGGGDDDEVYRRAFAAERVFHGEPSGLDHTVAMRGGLLRFVRGEPPEITPVEARRSQRLVIADVCEGCDTSVQVAIVSQFRRDHPATAERVLDAIGEVTDEAVSALELGETARIGHLMDANHHLLAALGVSSPRLDQACAAARRAGAIGAKLTGAGGGGCIIAIVEPETEQLVEQALAQTCRQTFVASVG